MYCIIYNDGPEAKGSNPTTGLTCSGPVTHSGEALTTGKSHGKKPDTSSLNDDTDVKKVSRDKLTHCGRVTQICVFNTVKLSTSASSP